VNIFGQDTEKLSVVWNVNTFDVISETDLDEKSAIYSRNERYRQGSNPGRLVFHNCGKTGHVAAKLYLKGKRMSE
jgi:hypothetical protein